MESCNFSKLSSYRAKLKTIIRQQRRNLQIARKVYFNGFPSSDSLTHLSFNMQGRLSRDPSSAQIVYDSYLRLYD